ncbi:hypothetical protein [Mycobacterium marinum]|uniref:hypothetical protein n=1 Tax=Mycobacterium marinum TaxID=1781 RepID=UPI003561540D
MRFLSIWLLRGSTPPEVPDLGTPGDVAKYLHSTAANLAEFRYSGKGPGLSRLGAGFSTADPTLQIGWTATRCNELTIPVADAHNRLVHIIRDLISEAVTNGFCMCDE